MSQRCIACHTEIGWSRGAKRGLHARSDYAECASCHPDHAGRGFALVRWEEGSPERFRHERTGYALEGSHARVPCAKCHAAANQKAPVAARIRKKDRDHSFLGLERACATCHADPHAGRFGAGCERCHRVSAWKDLDAAGFDHERTRYPLRGRHAAVACADCHDETRAWGKTPRFDRCDACHKDAHAGQAKRSGRVVDCAACHGVDAFAPSTYSEAMHATSDYPLEGRHRTVACAACHRQAAAGASKAALGSAGFSFRPKHAACTDCHSDPHGGQPMPRTAASCVSCHDLRAFQPARFTAGNHAKTAFPLDGAHEAATCRACHDAHRTGLAPLRDPKRFGSAGFAMQIPERACAECHADLHKGRFTAGCASCHGDAAFRPAGVSVAEHAAYRFPLEGAHRAVPCVDCHRELGRASKGSTLVRAKARIPAMTFAIAEQACADCHKDPHAGQFGRPAARAATCERCHDLDRFRSASRFDHGRDTAFALDGAHRGVACAACHVAARGAKGAGVIQYRGVSSKCEACHTVTGGKS